MIYTPPTAPDTAAANQPSQAASAPSGRRYTLIFGMVIAVVTVLALGLAALAPELGAQASVIHPSGWNVLYQSDLTAPSATDAKAWDLTRGCSFASGGMNADATNNVPAVCDFTLAGQGGETVAGFSMEVTVAPAARTPAFERAMIVLGDTINGSSETVFFAVGQDGNYVICDGACDSSSAAPAVYLASGTVAWHSDGWVSNTMAVRVAPNHSDITFFVNGQRIAEISRNIGANPGVAVGATSGDGAIFTAATFSTGE